MRTVRTKPWNDLIQDKYSRPYLPLLEFIAVSDFASELHGGVFLSGLLISDEVEFEFGINMLQVESTSKGFVFHYSRGPGYPKDTVRKECSREDGARTMDLLLKTKFGVNLGLKRENG